MRHLCEIPSAVKPLAVHTYFHRVRFWRRRPLSDPQLAAVRRECRGPDRLRVANEPAWFDSRYRQKIDLHHPSPKALHMVARLDDAFVNYVEVTCDFVLGDHYAAEWWLDRFRDHFLQPWHRPTMGMKSYAEGDSTRQPPQPGQRRTGHWFQWYIDKPCRITGDPHCFHFEGKHQGIAAVRKLGIHRPADLVGFDFDSYFIRRMKLYTVDRERLGRFHHNRRAGSRRQKSRDRWTRYVDRMRGNGIYRVHSLHPYDRQDPEANIHHSLQQFVDSYGRGPFLSPPHLIYDHVHI